MTVDLHLKIDFRSGLPIYIQVMDQIKHMIAAGELNIGDQLPTVRQLAADLRVNFNTVARSYKLLDESGIISTQHGRGTYILELPSEENGEMLRREDLRRLTRGYLGAVHQLDYTVDEVRAMLEKKLDLWQKNGIPPLPEDDDKSISNT
jgi:GntR family transcriptional regulator